MTDRTTESQVDRLFLDRWSPRAFDDAARIELGVPDDFRIEAAAAVGRQADPSILPDALRDKEKPSGRKPIDEVAFSGNFVA